MSETRPLPTPNADSEPYWAAAKAERLLLQKCSVCRFLYFMPRYLCPNCWSPEKDWVQASGRGTVYSFSVIHRAPLPSLGKDVPYVIALIELEEGPRMMTNIVGEGALNVKIGDPVTLCFEDRGDVTLPQFRLSC